MPDEFCEHLESYQLNFADAQEAYLLCLELMDKLLAHESGPEIVEELQEGLDSWEQRTRELRTRFMSLQEYKEILLPKEGANSEPVCAHCGCVVPRLAFPEFVFQDDGTVLFRGQELARPEPVPA